MCAKAIESVFENNYRFFFPISWHHSNKCIWRFKKIKVFLHIFSLHRSHEKSHKITTYTDSYRKKVSLIMAVCSTMMSVCEPTNMFIWYMLCYTATNSFWWNIHNAKWANTTWCQLCHVSKHAANIRISKCDKQK